MKKLRCEGCGPHPFKGQKTAVEETTAFGPVAIQRRQRGKDLARWTWKDALRTKDDQRGALLLVTAILQQTSTGKSQHKVRCAPGTFEESGCPQPFLIITDPGGSFGNRRDKRLRILGTRATLARYREARVFEEGCTLVYGPVKGEAYTVWEEARLEAVRRLARLDREKLRAIVEAADLARASRLHYKDEELAKGRSTRELTELWVDAIQARIDEVVQARCPSKS